MFCSAIYRKIIDEDKTKCDYSKAIEKLSDPNRVENRAAEERILNNLVELTERKEIEKMRFEVTEKPNGNNAIPIVPVVRNFQSARRMAQENLEHQPLPDSIMDRAYRRMQARGDLNPELALDVTPICTGAWNSVTNFESLAINISTFFRCRRENTQSRSNSLHEIESLSTENVRRRSKTTRHIDA